MPISPETIHAWNVAHARLALGAARETELVTELEQLAAAIAKARPGLAFDAEPADFRAALLATAEPAA